MRRDHAQYPRRTVLISGASIAGAASAYWLDRYGFDVTVVERADAVRSGGYPIDVRGTATWSSAWGCYRNCGRRISTRAC